MFLRITAFLHAHHWRHVDVICQAAQQLLVLQVPVLVRRRAGESCRTTGSGTQPHLLHAAGPQSQGQGHPHLHPQAQGQQAAALG